MPDHLSMDAIDFRCFAITLDKQGLYYAITIKETYFKDTYSEQTTLFI